MFVECRKFCIFHLPAQAAELTRVKKRTFKWRSKRCDGRVVITVAMKLLCIPMLIVGVATLNMLSTPGFVNRFWWIIKANCNSWIHKIKHEEVTEVKWIWHVHLSYIYSFLINWFVLLCNRLRFYFLYSKLHLQCRFHTDMFSSKNRLALCMYSFNHLNSIRVQCELLAFRQWFLINLANELDGGQTETNAKRKKKKYGIAKSISG